MKQLSIKNNPFNLARASDYTDQQIHNYWVDLSGQKLFSLIEPNSKTPMHILGGKGSGKTHLMRYVSYPVRKINASGDTLDLVIEDNFIGVYLRVNVLDTGRLSGKNISDEKWSSIFNYFFEISLVQVLISCLLDLAKNSKTLQEGLDNIALNCIELFDIEPQNSINNLHSLDDYFTKVRKNINEQVNNAAFTNKLDISIKFSIGAFLFGLPKLLETSNLPINNLNILYLIDEIENLTESQQQFINTLERHRDGPCSFRVGARLYGFKTLKVLGTSELNKPGSEFSVLYLDDKMRSYKRYNEFAKTLIIKRLISEKIFKQISDNGKLANELHKYFDSLDSSNFYKSVTDKLVKESISKKRIYFKRLHEELTELSKKDDKYVDLDIDFVIDNLIITEFPILEKLNIFLLYQSMYKKRDLEEESSSIKVKCLKFLEKNNNRGKYYSTYSHFAQDMLAQLYKDMKYSPAPMYAGLENIINMSAGMPRNLLVILHYIYKWSSLNGESPFIDSPISLNSQVEGFYESSQFIFEEDARVGEDLPRIKKYISKLGEVIREHRYSSKPVECSPFAFSYDEDNISNSALDNIKKSLSWSYIFTAPTENRPDANSKKLKSKMQLNPMISPKWDLPIYVRGDVRLNKELIECVFTDVSENDFNKKLNEYKNRMRAPLFNKESSKTNSKSKLNKKQRDLF